MDLALSIQNQVSFFSFDAVFVNNMMRAVTSAEQRQLSDNDDAHVHISCEKIQIG